MDEEKRLWVGVIVGEAVGGALKHEGPVVWPGMF
jgi:hypothetical protein